MPKKWKPLGMFSEMQAVSCQGTDLWRHVGEWKQTGQIRLPHPQYSSQLDLLRIYTLELGDRTITFASAEVSPGGYAFYVFE